MIALSVKVSEQNSLFMGSDDTLANFIYLALRILWG